MLDLKGAIMRLFLNNLFRFSTFFEADGAAMGSGIAEGADTSSKDSGDDQSNTQTFTQADLNRIGAQEKAAGKKSILKELGFEDEKTAKDAITKYNEWKASQQTEAEKNQEKLTAATNAQSAAEARATLAENKLEIMKAGGNATSVDDIMAMISVRVNDKTDFNTALEAVKKAYPNFFGENSGSNTDNGTGGGLNRQNNNKSKSAEGIGTRLAQNRIKNNTVKNPYFND